MVCQALGARAAAFHSQWVQTLEAGEGADAAAEAANAAPMRALENDALALINAPTNLAASAPSY